MHHQTGAYFVWTVEGKPVSVHLNTEVLRQLTPSTTEHGRRVPESGGLLTGFIRSTGENWLVAAEGFIPFDSEHARGESWTLSRRDRQKFAAQISRLNAQGSAGPVAVGWYRTHSRPGLFLDQQDFAMFRDFFSHPASIALLAEAQGPDPEAGIFFWENGDIQRSHPVSRFPLATAASPTAPASIEKAPRQGRRTFLPVSLGSELIAKVAPIRKNAFLAVPVAAGLALGMFWNPLPLRQTEAAALPASVSHADNATPTVPLPAGSDDPELSERTEAAALPDPASETGAIYTPPPEDPWEHTTKPAKVVRTPKKKQPVKVAVLPAAKQPRKAEVLFASNAPSIGAIGSYAGVLSSGPSGVEATSTIEPVRPSAFRRVVGSIPGLGFIKKQDRKKETYTAARPVHQVRPHLPQIPAEDTPVRIRLLVSSAGSVERAEMVSRRVEPKVAELVLAAVKRWQFEPARLEEKPVASEMMVTFRFPTNGAPGI